MTCGAQCTASDWGQDRRRSDLTLHGAVMAMSLLVARDNSSTPEINTSDHTRSRAWVVAATTRRPNHQTIWSHAAWAPGIVPHERRYDTSTAPSSPDRRLRMLASHRRSDCAATRPAPRVRTWDIWCAAFGVGSLPPCFRRHGATDSAQLCPSHYARRLPQAPARWSARGDAHPTSILKR